MELGTPPGGERAGVMDRAGQKQQWANSLCWPQNVPSDACDNIPVGITPPIEEVNISCPDSLAWLPKRQWIFREEAIQLDGT